MKVYTVFFIQKEFALHFYQKSEILYRFIQSYKKHRQDQNLAKQFDYVTIDIMKDDLKNHIQVSASSKMEITIEKDQIEMNQTGTFLTLVIDQKSITIYCQSLSDAETLLFPLLRTFYPYVFAIGNEFDNYKHFGWISPIAKNKFHKNDQVLYSNG